MLFPSRTMAMAEVEKMPPGQAKNTMESSLLVILLRATKEKT
jgi:hypothetical protein